MSLLSAAFLTIFVVSAVLMGLGLWLGSYERRIDLGGSADAMDEPFGDVPNPRGRG